MSKEVQKEVKQEVDTKTLKTDVRLRFGYQDKEQPEQFHKHVGFGKRPTGADFMAAAEESNSDIQFSLALAQTAITEFGQLEMPVPLTVLLSLNQIDREKLLKTYFSFLVDTGSNGEILADGKVRLGFGFERSGKRVTNVEFGKLLTGYDEIDIESEAKTGWQAHSMRLAKEIIAPADLTLAEIEALDVDDFTLLRSAEESWLNSFRGD